MFGPVRQPEYQPEKVTYNGVEEQTQEQVLQTGLVRFRNQTDCGAWHFSQVLDSPDLFKVHFEKRDNL